MFNILVSSNDSNAKTAYNYELGSNKINTTYSAKIGLMYVSDYYYAATPTYWSNKGFDMIIGGSSATFTGYALAFNYNWLALGV